MIVNNEPVPKNYFDMPSFLGVEGELQESETLEYAHLGKVDGFKLIDIG